MGIGEDAPAWGVNESGRRQPGRETTVPSVFDGVIHLKVVRVEDLDIVVNVTNISGWSFFDVDSFHGGGRVYEDT